MANITKSVAENVAGEFFVDSTCIDCDACRQIAPSVFAEGPGHSYVRAQPQSPGEHRQALHALLACPTGSIGFRGDNRAREAIDDFPLPVEGAVFYCGFNSPKSYGGNSYFIRHAAGNWLIDSPKFLGPLVKRLEALGGVAKIFVTHRDDVADAARFARHFGARRIINRRELSSQPGAEFVIEGDEPIEMPGGFVIIPTSGHTAGHCVLLFAQRYLFTGDHLAWDRERSALTAFRDYCWYSWEEQTASMARLAEYRFEWVLPGHGQRFRLPADEMSRQMRVLVEAMRSSTSAFRG